ncbi:PDZ domain-containing protein, partial [bacterium]|nr:PDZ domain-containing protein [bacterium]
MRAKTLLLSLLATMWFLSAASAWAKEGGAFLGIVPEEVTSDIAASYGVQTGQGVLVEKTVGDSPADEAGLRSNDILLAIDGQSLTGPGELRVQLAKHKEGDTVSITYMRGGKQQTASVKLDAADEPDFDFSWTPGPEFEKKMADIGPKIERKMMKFHDSDAAFAGVVTQSL